MLNTQYYDAQTDSLKLEAYTAIYDAILSLSFDADGYGLFDNITDEDIQKCKWIAAILEVLNDVPKRRVEHIFKHKKIDFNYIEFIEEDECQ